MNPNAKLVDERTAEADFIDCIADLLPVEQRALWYRDMAHLRRLPPDDEMLRIARAMGFLAVVTRQTPVQIAIEREKLAVIMDESAKAIQSTGRDVVSLHHQLEERLTRLPTEISTGFNPGAIAAKLSESLRQQFVQTGILETAQGLAAVAKETREVAGEFHRSSKELTDSFRSADRNARQAIVEIEMRIRDATTAAQRAASDLTRTFLSEYKWSVFVLCTAALMLGFALGILYHRWINSSSPDPRANAVVLPSNPASVAPSAPTNRPANKALGTRRRDDAHK